MVVLIWTETHKGDGINNWYNWNWLTDEINLSIVS